MTDRRTQFSRRSLFSLTTGGASALVLSQAFGGDAHAFGPTIKPVFKPVADSKLPAGLLVAPGDVKLDPAVRALAEKMLARAKHGITTALTRPDEAPKDDKIVAAGLKITAGLRPARAARVRTSALKIVSSSALKAKHLGAYAKVGPKLHALDEFTAELTKVKDVELTKLKARPKVKVPEWKAPLIKKIEFHLNSVKCVEDTSEIDSDEILLAGQLVEPNGNIKKITRFKVHDDFDKGDTRHYDYSKCGDLPPGTHPFGADLCPNGSPSDRYVGRKLVTSTIDLDKVPWPATLGLNLIMGEEDSGGFSDIVQDVYNALKGEIEAELLALGAAAGGALGSIFPGLGTAIGAAIGAALTWLVGELFEWLFTLFDDDLIQARSWIVQLPSPELVAIQALASDHLSAPAGVWASPMKKIKFRGDGGEFHARLHWRVIT